MHFCCFEASSVTPVYFSVGFDVAILLVSLFYVMFHRCLLCSTGVCYGCSVSLVLVIF